MLEVEVVARISTLDGKLSAMLTFEVEDAASSHEQKPEASRFRATRRRLIHGSALLVAMAILATATVALIGPSDTPPPPPPVAGIAIDPGMEGEFVALVNAEREREGLQPLSVDDGVRDVARRHSVLMAQRDELHHNPTFGEEIADWLVVAENVGRGPSVEAIHDAFMNSESHRANILLESVTDIGVGVEVHDDQLWVTQNFRGPS